MDLIIDSNDQPCDRRIYTNGFLHKVKYILKFTYELCVFFLK